MLFISLILMSALNPSVKKLEQLRIPRWLAILMIYLLILAVVVLAIGGIIPPLIDQTSTLINQIPFILEKFKVLGVDEKLIASQISQFTTIPANILKFIFNVFSNVVTILGLIVITFYMLMERGNLDKYLVLLFGEDKEKEVKAIIDQIEYRLGGWVRGELALMSFVGVLSYIGYRIVGLEFALPLAILAFVFEILPNIGPTIAALPAILIGLTVSPVQALVVAGVAFFIQQVENSILVPRVMKKAAGVNPLVSILALAIGFKLAGLGGAILAIPTFIALEVIFSAISSSKRFKEA